jgi:hypothetical protein
MNRRHEHFHLTLRSGLQGRVSKGRNEHYVCCASFETLRFARLLRMRLGGAPGIEDFL